MIPKSLVARDFRRGTTTEEELIRILGTVEYCVKENLTQRYVEFGTHLALTSRVIVDALNKLGSDSELIGIDIAKQQRFSKAVAMKRRQGFFTAAEMWKENVGPVSDVGPCRPQFVEGQSFEIAKQVVEPVCWVFIDGCHCFECCFADLNAWLPKIEKYGLALIHDCHPLYSKYTKTQEYHGTKPAHFGVLKAVEKCELLHQDFDLLFQTKVKRLSNSRLFGGMQIWRRRDITQI
jgi:hypothetical protein